MSAEHGGHGDEQVTFTSIKASIFLALLGIGATYILKSSATFESPLIKC